MATLSSNNMNIADIIRRTKPDGTVAHIGEILDEMLTLANDAPFIQGNLPNAHMTVQRTSLPTFSTRNPNGSTTPTKSTTSQTIESPEYIEAFSDVDELVLRYGGQVESQRAAEAVSFAQSGLQTVSNRFIYGNGSTTPGQMTGIMVRYADTTANNGDNVILGGSASGQTDNMSILLMNWGESTVHGWYPQGTSAGLKVTDWGKGIRPDSSALKVMYTEQWQWGFGIAIPDWRGITRIGNIDQSLLIAGTGADLFDKMMQAIWTQTATVIGRQAFYMNRTNGMMLDIQARNEVKAGGQLGYADVGGQRLRTFQGIPINIEDTLTESETRIT